MKYRKKQVVIEAAQYEPGMEDGFSCIPFVSACRWKNEDGDYKQCMQCKLDIPKKPFISTPEGNDYIDGGDWIITGVNGKRYLCDPNIFEMTYEPVEMDIGAQQTSLDEDIPTICEHLRKIRVHNPDDEVEQLLSRIKQEIIEFL